MDQAPAAPRTAVIRRLRGILVGALLVAAIPAPAAVGGPIPSAPDCSVFPADNHWNLPITDLPVVGNSRKIVRSAGLGTGLHPDFGSGKYDGGPIGIPFVSVPGSQKKVPVSFTYKGESDKGPYPIPKNVPIEGGRRSDGDRHVIVVDRQNCTLYEVFNARPRRWGFEMEGRLGCDLGS